jgi:WD40 repeat protein
VGAYRQGIADLAFSPDAALLATIGRHRESTLRLWQDDRTGEWKERAAIPIGRCLFVRFDATGALLAVACETDVMLLDVATRRVAATLPSPHPEPLTAFDLAVDGRRAITAGHEGGVTVWEIGTASAVRTFSVRRSRRKHGPPKGMEADTAWAVAVALTTDSKRAAAATIEGSVFVWDLDTGAELLADVDNDATGPPHGALRFTADGRLLVPTGDRSGMRLIDPARKRSQVVTSGAKAFHAVSVADDATRYAVLTSSLGDRQLTYAVDVWRFALPPLSP